MFAVSGKRFHQTKTASVGETVYLLCGGAERLDSHVDWLYQTSEDEDGDQIISGGYLRNGNRAGRLGTDVSTLFIHNAQTNDSGVYTCREDSGNGPEHRVILAVQGKFSELVFRSTCCKCRQYQGHLL